MGESLDTTLKLRVKHIPDGGKDVKHPELQYRFSSYDAERIIGKYHLEDGVTLEDIRGILRNEDWRNYGLAADHADFVDVIISRGRGANFRQEAKRYDFSKREISSLIV